MHLLEREPKEQAADWCYRVLLHNIQMLYMPPGAILREPDLGIRKPNKWVSGEAR